MRAEELWKEYCEKENIYINTPYEVWGFGDAHDQLADLVLTGIKTATASGYDLYFIEGEEEPLPQLGDYSVILNSRMRQFVLFKPLRLQWFHLIKYQRSMPTRKVKETEVLHTGE